MIVFSPSGLIIACTTNAPGSMHDSQICDWGGLYEKMEDAFNITGDKVVVDSDFCRENHEYLIKSAQEESTADGALDVLRLQQATSLR